MPPPSSAVRSHFNDFIRGLRGALPYLEEFHNETFVIQVSGHTLQQKNLSGILEDLILLHRIGIKIILVHGADPQIQAMLLAHGKTTSHKEGRLFIPLPDLPLAQQAIATTNWQLITHLSRYGGDIFPFSGHFVQAEKATFAHETKPHATGNVQAIHSKALQHAFGQHHLPLLAPFAIGAKGRLWVLEPNQLAMEIAARLRARKLIILESEENFPQSHMERLRETTTQNMRQWLQEVSSSQQTALKPPTHLQAQALTEACERGVERCQWLNSSIEGVILGETLTSAGMGIMVTNSTYEHTRFARLPDAHRIFQILEKPVNDLILVHKSQTYLEQHIENFLVFCVDEEIVGCCELIFFEESHAVEIASLAVKEVYRNRGIGKRLIAAAQEKAKRQEQKLLFALTTQASHVFVANGFKEISPDQLPQAKRTNYDFRDSLIYGKRLSGKHPERG